MSGILTENRNPNSMDIDEQSTINIVKIINNEDFKVAAAVQKNLEEIAKAVDVISENFSKGGRLLYFGAGTSGRLGVLDASECPPTFGVSPNMVQGIIAGGDFAIKNAVEGAEDNEDLASDDIKRLDLTPHDTVVGISANGNAKYVIKIMELAKKNGCAAIAVTSNKNAKIKEFADYFICCETGEEVISGSTRMKSGTAQKMVLNILTTASMIKIGKVFENLMVEVKPVNEKLKERAVKITACIARVDYEEALCAMKENNYEIKISVLKLKYNLSKDESEKILKHYGGVLKKCFQHLEKMSF